MTANWKNPTERNADGWCFDDLETYRSYETSDPLAASILYRAVSAERERDKLQAFKDWTHTYLDSHGVPHHPPGTHGAEGCRIGDRMDWLINQRDQLAADLAAAKRELAMWKPLSPEEAEAALEAAEAVPLSEEQATRIMEKITDPAYCPTNQERAYLSVRRIDELERELAAAREECERLTKIAVELRQCAKRDGIFTDSELWGLIEKLQPTGERVKG